MLEKLRRLFRDEEAPTAVEYAIMVAGIAVVIIAVVFILGTNVRATFHNVATNIPTGGS
jgi:pilus assembly protein Flp/PilA